MERTLQVLDYAILVINGMDGVQSHTMTLWRLLERYEIPVFLFVNKMDQQGTDHDALLRDLRKRLNENCMDFACLTEDNSERAVGDDKTESMKSGTDTSEDLDDLMEILPCVRKSFWKPIWKQERLLTEKSAV